MNECTVTDCVGRHRARGLCNLHYRRFMKTGFTDKVCKNGHVLTPNNVFKRSYKNDYVRCKVCMKSQTRKFNQTDKGKAGMIRRRKVSYAKFKHKFHARSLVAKAVKRGEIAKPPTCSRCGGRGARIEGHHENYAEPLKVIWLCSQCHHDLHHQKLVLLPKRGCQ